MATRNNASRSVHDMVAKSDMKAWQLFIANNDSAHVIARTNERNKKGQTPLHLAAVSPANYALVEMLLKVDGIEVSPQDDTGRTPLHLAVRANHPDAVLMLLGKGAEVSIPDKQGKLPLQLRPAEVDEAVAAIVGIKRRRWHRKLIKKVRRAKIFKKKAPPPPRKLLLSSTEQSLFHLDPVTPKGEKTPKHSEYSGSPATIRRNTSTPAHTRFGSVQDNPRFNAKPAFRSSLATQFSGRDDDVAPPPDDDDDCSNQDELDDNDNDNDALDDDDDALDDDDDDALDDDDAFDEENNNNKLENTHSSALTAEAVVRHEVIEVGHSSHVVADDEFEFFEYFDDDEVANCGDDGDEAGIVPQFSPPPRSSTNLTVLEASVLRTAEMQEFVLKRRDSLDRKKERLQQIKHDSMRDLGRRETPSDSPFVFATSGSCPLPATQGTAGGEEGMLAQPQPRGGGKRSDAGGGTEQEVSGVESPVLPDRAGSDASRSYRPRESTPSSPLPPPPQKEKDKDDENKDGEEELDEDDESGKSRRSHSFFWANPMAAWKKHRDSVAQRMSSERSSRRETIVNRFQSRMDRASVFVDEDVVISPGVAAGLARGLRLSREEVMAGEVTWLLNKAGGHDFLQLRCKSRSPMILKPLQNKGRGEREVAFFEAVANGELSGHVRKWIPTYYGVVQLGTFLFIVMEDLTARFSDTVNLMDLKMGVRTYAKDAKRDKLVTELLKYIPQQHLGFRMTGMRVHDPDPRAPPRVLDQKFGHSLTVNTVKDAIHYFFSGSDADGRLNVEAVRKALAQLNELLEWIPSAEEQVSFIASSLLFIHDTDSGEVLLRLIDFGNARFLDSGKHCESAGGVCVAHGVRTLVEIMRGLQNKQNCQSLRLGRYEGNKPPWEMA